MRFDTQAINKRRQRNKNIKKIIDIIIVILLYNIILVLISCVNKIEQISIGGFKAYNITTNSMEPTIKIGDIVIVKKIEQENIKKDDIITFNVDDEIITHRIARIEEIDNKIQYITKGDNNNIEDNKKVSYDEIEGKYIMLIPYVGKILILFKNKIIFLCIILIILILTLYKITIQEKKEYRLEKKMIEDIRNEKNKTK